MTIHIISYNLLRHINKHEYNFYHKCKHEYLATNYRWKLIQSQLQEEITNNELTIICLQEVCLTSLPKLELFFRQLNYSFFHNLYGYKGDDYIGVGIAVPTTMEVRSLEFVKIGDHLRSITRPIQIESNWMTWIWSLSQYVKSKFFKLPSDPWQIAMMKRNTLIHLRVRIKNKNLCIGTYHMPCAFAEPDVMAIHSSVVKDLMFKLSSGDRFVFAGDFNSPPFGICYKILTEEGFNDYQLPNSSKLTISHHNNVKNALKSAYFEKNGSEPTYTNYLDSSRSSRYCNTLDYIFYSGRLQIKNVLELPDQPTGESYPDETHPSDHLMLAATFQLL